MRDRRQERRRFVYGKGPSASVAAKMPCVRARRDDPLLRPGQCRVEGGEILVRCYETPEEAGFEVNHRGDPSVTPHQRMLAKFSYDVAEAFRAGIAYAIRHRMTT